MQECHVFIHSIESQPALCVVQINPNSSELFHVQRGLHVGVPGRKGSSIPLDTPGEVISCDAAAARVALTLNTFVGQANVRALTTDVCLKVVAVQVEALRGQDLPAVLESIRYVGVRVLPGGGVRHLLVLLGQAEKRVSCVGIKTHRRDDCGGFSEKKATLTLSSSTTSFKLHLIKHQRRFVIWKKKTYLKMKETSLFETSKQLFFCQNKTQIYFFYF